MTPLIPMPVASTGGAVLLGDKLVAKPEKVVELPDTSAHVTPAKTFLVYFGVCAFINAMLGGVQIMRPTTFARDPTVVSFYPFWTGVVLIVYLGAICAFIIWFHSAYKNLLRLGVRRLKYSPAWAVAGWFIPIIALVLPFLVAREMWIESSLAGADSDDPHKGKPDYSVLGPWWFFLLLTNILVGLTAPGIMILGRTQGVDLETLRVAAAGNIAGVLWAVSSFTVISTIQKMQRASMEGR